MTPSTRWLDADEQRAWRALAAVLLKLPAALEQQLHRSSDLSHFEYWVLALLSESPQRTLRLSQLAGQANASLSRLSHVVTRLERRGFVVRERCPDDARANLAILTDEGWSKIVDAAPDHVETVRRLVFDALEPDDVATLERICARLIEAVERT